MNRERNAIGDGFEVFLVLFFCGLLSSGSFLREAAAASSCETYSARPHDLNTRELHELFREDALRGLPEWTAGQSPISRRESERLLGESAGGERGHTKLGLCARSELELEEVFSSWRYTNALRGTSDPKNRQSVHKVLVNPLAISGADSHYTKQNGQVWQTGFRIGADEVADVFSFEFRPTVNVLWEESGPMESTFDIDRLYVQANLANWVIRAGRQELGWGFSPDGGLFWSGNPRPADMILVTHDRPFRFPSIFKHLGNVRFSSFIAHSGEDRHIPHARIFGTKMNVRLNEYFEWGVTQTLMFGGDGADNIEPWEVFREAFTPFKNQSVEGSPENITDGRAGAEFRLRVPVFFNFVWSYETIIDDGRSGDLWKLYKDQVGYRSLFYWPVVDPWRSTSLTIEYARMPFLVYTHGRWRTGYSLDGRYLGDPYGPQHKRWALELRSNFGKNKALTLHQRFQFLERNNDDYRQVRDSANFLRVVPTTNRPREKSFSWQPSLTWFPNERIEAQFDFGIERVTNVNFEQDRSATHFLGGFQTKLRF